MDGSKHVSSLDNEVPRSSQTLHVRACWAREGVKLLGTVSVLTSKSRLRSDSDCHASGAAAALNFVQLFESKAQSDGT